MGEESGKGDWKHGDVDEVVKFWPWRRVESGI